MNEAATLSHDASRPSLWKRLTTRRFLFISIALHVVFGLVAAGLVVQTITAKRKLTFTAAPPSANPGQKALEHKVQVAKKQNSMSAPMSSKRIATTGLSKVSLPEMPAMPSSDAVAGMSGVGGPGFGAGPSFGAIGSGGGGGPVPLFGLKNPGGGALAGTFYDLKQDRKKKPTGMDENKYREAADLFVKSGWSTNRLDDYYEAPRKLFTTQFLIPDINANEGPKAYEVEKQVAPKWWVVHYKGDVIPSDSGTFHFVANGDDIMFVRFNGKNVLDAGWKSPKARRVVTPQAIYDYEWPKTDRFPKGQPEGTFAKGEPIQVEAGRSYPMEVLIGESGGGKAHYVLLIEKKGETYKKDAKGNPILPVFRLANSKLPTKGNYPPFSETGPVWSAAQTKAAAPTSALDEFKKQQQTLPPR